MSITIDIQKEVANGNPLLFWVNRFDPFVVGSAITAHSGKVCIIKTTVDLEKGKPMVVAFRMAKKAHLDAWKAMVNNDPFGTTALASYFNTGYSVIFNPKDPIKIEHEILKDQWDLDQTKFDSGDDDYLEGFDRFKGVMNFIIVDAS